jgi:hypothetical protein
MPSCYGAQSPARSASDADTSSAQTTVLVARPPGGRSPPSGASRGRTARPTCQANAVMSTSRCPERASFTSCSSRRAVASSIHSSPHWEQTVACTRRTTTTPLPKSAVNVVSPLVLFPPHSGHWLICAFITFAKLRVQPAFAERACAIQFSRRQLPRGEQRDLEDSL